MSKKVTNKAWLDKRAQKLQIAKYHRNKKGNSGYTLATKQTNNKNVDDNFYLRSNRSIKTVPQNFSFVDNPTETIDFFDDIVCEIQQKIYKNTFFIDSSHVSNVTVDALIYLIAIMQNVQINYDMLYTFKGNLPLNSDVAQIYQNSGFMSYVSSKLKSLPASTERMKIVSGCKNDPIITSNLCQFIMEKLNKQRTDIIPIQKVLIELMSNVYHHAYNNNDDIMRNHWYLYAEHVNQSVRVIFLDTGASIPRTVRKNFLEKVQRITKTNLTDGDLIYSTLQGDFRTETNEPHRGNGLSGVRELATTPTFKNFSVISGSGVCYFSKEKILMKQDYSNKIYGTIFMFDII